MPDRQFLVGETITIYARVSVPGTKQPEDANSVVLTGLAPAGGSPLVVATTAFAHDAVGQYRLDVPTDGMAAGTYNYVVTVTGTDASGTAKVTKVEDRFVLKNPLVSGA